MSVPENSNDLANLSDLHGAAEMLIASRSRAVLLIEDTAAHAAIIRRAFDTSIWSLEHVTRGALALDAFQKNPNSIVLLDLTLPDIDGFELLSKLNHLNSGAPIIVITATDKVSVSIEAMQRGACDYVVKSEPKELEAQIVRAVNRAWAARLHRAERDLIEKTKIVELVKSERLEAIETLVRTVCHEINNPLCGVVALSQILSEKNLDSDIKRIAREIFEAASQVAQVVHKLQDVGDAVVEFGGKEILALNKE